MSEKQSYAAGESVFQGGESTRHFYILATERIRLPLSEGGQVAYTSSAQTVSHLDVVPIESKGLQQILAGDPPSALIFYRHFAEFIGQRLSNSYKAIIFVHGERSSLTYG